MLFSKELDKSLFLILKNDRKNRKEIVNFLIGIPKNLRYKMQYEIGRYQYRYDECINSNLSRKFISDDGSSYSYKYEGEIDELLILRTTLNNETSILSLSSYNRHIGKYYNVKLENNKLKKKEYTYGISEKPNKKIFYRINDVRNIEVPLMRKIKDDNKGRSLRLSDLEKFK